MPEKKSIKEMVYDELRRNIVSLRFVPGQVMSTKVIASKLEVSSTPVREAMLLLQAEGLVEMIPQRETKVSKINLNQIEQEKFIRECLELGVIDLFIKRKKKEDIRKMSALIEEQKRRTREQDYFGFIEADDEFHKVLFDVSQRTMAWDTISSRNAHYIRYRVLIVQNEMVASSSIEQHSQIVKLLDEGREEEVRQALRAHIQRIDLDNTELVKSHQDYFEDRAYGSAGFHLGTL